MIADGCKVMENSVRQGIIRRRACLLLSLFQWKFMSTFRALSHSALHGRRTATTRKCSAIHYIKSETTFWTFHYMLRLRTHFKSLTLNQPSGKILKTFLNNSKHFYAKILTILKTIKYYNSFHMKNC